MLVFKGIYRMNSDNKINVRDGIRENKINLAEEINDVFIFLVFVE